MPLYLPWRSKVPTGQVESIPTTDGGLLIQVARGRQVIELAELRPNEVHTVVMRADGTIEDVGVAHNMRTNAGADWQAGLMGDAAGTPAKYIGLTADTTSLTGAETSLTSEISTAGLSRAAGTYSHSPAGSTNYVITKAFTATGTVSNIHRAALFTASSSGTMPFVANLNADVTVATDDTLTISWLIYI